MTRQDKTITKKRGRPATGLGTLIGVRLQPDQINRVDAWIAIHDEAGKTRPEAIRQLIAIGLDAGAAPAPSLDQRIARQEQKLTRKIPTKTSPAKGMAVLRKGLAEVEHRKLVEKKKMVDTSGKMRAGEPDLENRPKQATGKKGGDVQGAKLTSRARAAKVDPTNPRRRKP
jgi:hypothetical protein